jgi:hypothetical protein
MAPAIDFDKKDDITATVSPVHDEKVASHDEAVHVSEADNKLVRRKADRFLLPVFCLIYALQFVSCRVVQRAHG